MKKAIIYLRVSTDNQEYERQLYDLKTLAKRWDYDITAIYEEKRSAVKGMETRDELTKLRQLTKDDVDVILMWDITRLSRKAVDFIALINEFANKGICLHFFDRNIITLENDGSLNLMTQMYLYILGVFAQMDAENLKIKMESGKENALRNGNSYTSQAPLGYKIVDKKLVIDEEEAGSIRLIFKMYSEGKPLQEIADDFNARKIESRTKVNKWDKNVFYTILTNTAYYGKGKRISKNHGERFFDCPAIISKELFDLCRNVANKNKTNTDKSRKTDNLLRGLLKCGECNKSYILRNGSAGAAYGCSDNGTSVNNKLNCEGGTSNVAKTDAVIWEAIKEIYFKESFKEKTLEEKLSAEVKINDNNRLILHYETEIKENNKKLDKARSGYINGLLDDAFLHKVNNEVSSDTLRCNNNIDQLKADNLNLRRNIDEQSNFDEIINTELSHRSEERRVGKEC